MLEPLFHQNKDLTKEQINQCIIELGDLIDSSQRNDWERLFCGSPPTGQLKWNGTLQEVYYLFNELRKASKDPRFRLRIKTKNGGLDWVKINKIIVTPFGKVQKESRPNSTIGLNESLVLFVRYCINLK